MINRFQDAEKDYDAVHIIFGDSATGSLTYAMPKREKVIGLPELFSTGPIWYLHEDVGINARYEWLETHYLFEDGDLRNVSLRLKQAFLAIASIPENLPIYIWTGSNAHEQTGMRLALYLLKDKRNDLQIIHATSAAEALLNMADCTYSFYHSGEINAETFKLIYAQHQTNWLSAESRKWFEEEWLALAATREVLRVWEDEEIVSVPEDFFDAFIINTAQRLHDEDDQQDFMKSVRVIGEVMGYVEQYIGDQFIEYRVRHLIKNGIFEAQGVMKAMRFYSVKLS